ncbi:BspA family leucine-rich repeat surface protein [Lactobacillus sp. W8092]|nr:BspA family leucine-rich repeat surface protein [Lactobacillus sp. W8092]
MNQKKRIALTTTFAGLVCGFVLTQQQAAMAATNAPDPITTSMLSPDSTAPAARAQRIEPNQNDQQINQQTNSQKAATNTNAVSETDNQNQNYMNQSTDSLATTSVAQPATANNNPTTAAQPQQAAAAPNTTSTFPANSANDDIQSVNKVAASKTTNTTESPTSPKNNSITAAPQDLQAETIAQGTWGTSKWEYTHQDEGDNYILHFHAGTLGASSHGYDDNNNEVGSIGTSSEVFNGNWQWSKELTQIIIDPGVKANQDSSYLFAGLEDLQWIFGLANLETANVTNMSHMFEDYQGVSFDLSHLDTANVTDMSGMFMNYRLNSLDVSHFNTANVTDMSEMFAGCGQLIGLDLSNFNTSKVTDMTDMFDQCYNLISLDVSHFNTANVTKMACMFRYCYDLPSLDLSNFNTTNVTDMSRMFEWCPILSSLDVSHFNTSNVTDMSGMFMYCDKFTSLDLNNFNTANVTNMSGMFYNCGLLTKLDLSHFNTAKVTNMAAMFTVCERLTSLDLSNFNTAQVTDMSGMFDSCSSLTKLDLSNFNTAKVTNMYRMFYDCSGLTSLDVSHFNTASVTNMYRMFAECSGLTSLDVSHFNTANVTNMVEMFSGCSGLTGLDVSHFNTANITNMFDMFADCSGLSSLDVSHFNTSNVTDMSGMFYRCENLTSLDLSHFNTANVTSMWGMFHGCSGLTSLDLSSFNTANCTYLNEMFEYCENLNHLILGPNTLLNTNTILPNVPQTDTQIPGTEKRITSPYWVATSGYQQGHKYTSNELMGLTGRDKVTTYDWDSKPAFTQTTETKAVTRAIRIHQPDGYLKTELQTVMVHRPVTINPDGSKTYGAWSTAQWDAYQIPEIAGYQANNSSIAAQAVNGETVDQTIDVYYQPQLQTVEIQYLDQGQIVGKQTITGYTGQTIVPNYQVPEGYEITTATPATITIDGSGKQIIQVNVSHKQEESMEYKTITRTVNLHQTNGQIKTYNQVALLQRSVQIDAVTGNKTYGHWNTGYWDAINIPTVAGYTASQDQVADQVVTDQDTNQTVDVYYMPNN